MGKKVLNVLKKVGRTYINSMILYYQPIIDSKINPINV